MSLADALSGIDTGPAPTRGPKPLAPLFVGRMGCFDQTLSKAGSASLLFSKDGTITPVRSKMFEPSTDEEGNEGNFRKGVALHNAFVKWLQDEHIDFVAHEAPPVGGGKLHRPESSLMAALALRIACDSLAVPVVMVRPQDAKKRLTGDGKAEKRDVKLAIEALLPDVRNLRPWNQDVSDAIAVGLTASERKR